MPVSMKDIIAPRLTPSAERIKNYLNNLPDGEFVFSHEVKSKLHVGKETLHNFQMTKEGQEYFQLIGHTRYFGKPSSVKKLSKSIGATK